MNATAPCSMPNRTDEKTAAAEDLGRLLALEAAIERADEVLVDGDVQVAMGMWDRIARIAGDLLGDADAARVDAERVVAACLVRLGRHSEARRRIENVRDDLRGHHEASTLSTTIAKDLEALDAVMRVRVRAAS